MSRPDEEHEGLTRRDFLVGTGAATLALGMAHMIVQEKLYQAPYVVEQTD